MPQRPSVVFSVIFLSAAAFFSCSTHKAAQPEQTAKSSSAQVTIPQFDAEWAYQSIVAQVQFGSRAPETPAHDSCQKYIERELSLTADSYLTQHFTQTGYNGEELHLSNIIASFNVQATSRVLLCAHWDSRPRADQETNPALQSKPIPGANDGASGAAVLLELAKIFKTFPPPVGVDMVFFDGEDYGKESDLNLYCLGAQYFAKHLTAGFHPQCGVLLDLVGDKDAVFRREQMSDEYARGVCDLIWQAAQAVHAGTFVNAPGAGITDDHLPLNSAGIPTVDIIDAELVGNQSANPRRKYWHTLRDTPDNCSPTTLHDVGMTLLYLIYSELPHA